MPEMTEVKVFQEYINGFIDATPDVKDRQILCMHSDAKSSEAVVMKEREEVLLAHSITLGKKSTQLERTQWAAKLFKLAKGVPDTHGLMIYPVWRQLPLNLRVQISSNHPSWQSFILAFETLKDGESIIPISLPVPWHRLLLSSQSEPQKSLAQLKLPRPHLRIDTSPLPQPLEYPPMESPLTPLTAELPNKSLATQSPDALASETSETSPLPFKITSSPSESHLVRKITPQMAPTWRGPNPDPEVRAALKADKASKVKATPKESPNDAAYFPLFRKQPQSSYQFHIDFKLAKSKQTKPKGKVKIPTIEEGSQEDEDNKARYFWPSHHFPSLSQSHPHRLGPDIHPAVSSCPSRPPHAILTDLEDEEVFARVGLVLKAVCFDLRLIILDLTTCYLEFEPLLHSSPQIFTKEQWIGVSEVPHSVRGFKIGIALEM
ncbi:hypothetical protein DFH09DRAFT_1102707 [Mycena vulgaris]|nr:hypothetical protein DFH09DRAFT_1102707 [Mycena vulgaris]